MKITFLALCVALAAASLGHAAPPGLTAAYDCEGAACPQITLTWEEEGQQFRADNSSDRRVRVEVSTFAGPSSATVEAGKSEYLKVKGFNGPYRADFE